MPDYDPKSIPILDDVIETEENESIDFDELSAEDKASENNPDLFAEEPVELTAENLVSEDLPGRDISTDSLSTEENEPRIGTIDDITEENFSDEIHAHAFKTDEDSSIADSEEAFDESSLDITAASQETDETRSALIDYSTETEEPLAAIETEQPVATPPVSLESVVDDITRQLMPDLEQQLRYLIQQALEDRLPDDVINRLIDDHGEQDE